MKKEYWDVHSEPSYRLGAVMETYCARNSVHRLIGIEPRRYNSVGEMTGFDVLYEITEHPLNDGYTVETQRHDEARNLMELRISQGYNVFPVRIDNDQTTVVSVKQLPIKEQEYSSGRQR